MATSSTPEDNVTTPKRLEDMPPASLETPDELHLFDENGLEKG